MKNKILIITPSRNSERYLNQTVLSVVTQQGDFEIDYHVQDGLSSDGTIELLKKWKTYFQHNNRFQEGAPVRFSFSSEKDHTMYEAIQKGMDHMIKRNTSEEDRILMTWINSDDLLLPGAIQTAFQMIAKSGVAEVMTGYPYCITEDGTLMTTQEILAVSRDYLSCGYYDGRILPFISQEGTFWTKEIWDKVGGLRTDLKLCGDWDLWRRFAKESEILLFKGPLACHRRHQNQLSANLKVYWQEIDTTFGPIKPKREFGKHWGYTAWFCINENCYKLKKSQTAKPSLHPGKTGLFRSLERLLRACRKKILGKRI